MLSTSIYKKYLNKDLYIAFRLDDRDIESNWCLIKHDELVSIMKNNSKWLDEDKKSWTENGYYRAGKVNRKILPYIEKYIINTKRPLNL